MTRIIRTRSNSTTVSRPTTQKNSLDGTTETLSDHTEDMWLFEPREQVANEVVGERITGSLGALVVADSTVDVQKDDRVTHGGVEYEVDTVIGHPTDEAADGTASDGTDFFIVNFERRQ
jgi:hypothetical protein